MTLCSEHTDFQVLFFLILDYCSFGATSLSSLPGPYINMKYKRNDIETNVWLYYPRRVYVVYVL